MKEARGTSFVSKLHLVEKRNAISFMSKNIIHFVFDFQITISCLFFVLIHFNLFWVNQLLSKSKNSKL